MEDNINTIWKDLSTLSPKLSTAAPAPTWEAHFVDDHCRSIKLTNPPTPALLFSLEPTSKRSKHKSSDNLDSLERKRKRVLKNRESAVRSRARRQAYTYHLEAKILLLKQENAELKRKQQQHKQQKNNQQPEEEKHKLKRTLTAPF